MRNRRDWMNKAVDPILELLNESLVLNAQSIYFTLKDRSESAEDAPGRTTVYRAIERLEEHNYVQSIDENDSYYKITDQGIRYLEGKTDLRDEPDPDDE